MNIDLDSIDWDERSREMERLLRETVHHGALGIILSMIVLFQLEILNEVNPAALGELAYFRPYLAGAIVLYTLLPVISKTVSTIWRHGLKYTARRFERGGAA